MTGKVRVWEAGDIPGGGVWPMPDLPHAVRAVISVLLRHRIGDEHACEWPNGVKPPAEMNVGNCNCGAHVDVAQQIVAALGLDGDADLTWVVADLQRQLKMAEARERMAARHAMQCDVDVADGDARLAASQAETARLQATLRRRELELHDARNGDTGATARSRRRTRRGSRWRNGE